MELGNGISKKNNAPITLRDLMALGEAHPELMDLPIEHSDPEGNFPQKVLSAVYDQNEEGEKVLWVFG